MYILGTRHLVCPFPFQRNELRKKKFQQDIYIYIYQGREIAHLFGTNEAVMLSKQHGASRSLFLRQKLIVSDAFRCRADGPTPPPGPHRTRSDSSDRRREGEGE